MLEERRVETLKRILELIPHYLVDDLERGKDISSLLREEAIIFPHEYDRLLSRSVENLEELITSLNRLTTLIKRKQMMHELYIKYCQLFLGENPSYVDLTIEDNDSYNSFVNNDLRDEQGLIDYKPFLKKLGLSNDLSKKRK